jgi:hypothetical protein
MKDNSDSPQVHEFHFVIPESMKERLKKLDVFKNVAGVSGTVVKILSTLAPALRQEHKWRMQRMSKYRYISPDPDEERKHVHTYLDEDAYRELKLIHHDLNFYSIAQIVRMMLELFFGLLDEYGDDIFKELEKLFKEWEEFSEAFRLTLREELRHLWEISQHIPENRRIITLYDEHFAPFWTIWHNIR